jgi:hypothetical protein
MTEGTVFLDTYEMLNSAIGASHRGDCTSHGDMLIVDSNLVVIC